MTILEAVPGIEVTVCVDQQALQEYDDDAFEAASESQIEKYQASRTVAKYIESETGKKFSINVEISKEYKFDSPTVGFIVFVDGVEARRIIRKNNVYGFPNCGSAALKTDFFGGTTKMEGVLIGSENGQTLLKPFIFSNISISVDDSALASIKEDSYRLSVVGETMVKVYRKGERHQEPARPLSQIKLKVDASTPVHEKALKGQAISHATTLGVPHAVKKKARGISSFLDGEGYPIAVYRFKYRSKKSLQSLLILERTPEPAPSPSPPPILDRASGSFNLDNFDAAQKAKLQEFLGSLMGTSTQPSEERKIKREREESSSGTKASKPPRKGHRVEIDLTRDDSN